MQSLNPQRLSLNPQPLSLAELTAVVWARESVGIMLSKALLAILCLLMMSAPAPTPVGAEEDALHTPAGSENALRAEQVYVYIVFVLHVLYACMYM